MRCGPLNRATATRIHLGAIPRCSLATHGKSVSKVTPRNSAKSQPADKMKGAGLVAACVMARKLARSQSSRGPRAAVRLARANRRMGSRGGTGTSPPPSIAAERARVRVQVGGVALRVLEDLHGRRLDDEAEGQGDRA